MIKDLIEDYKRTKSDNQENKRKVEVLRNSQWQSETWESIYVGDMVRVQKEEYFPADVVLLASSE
jgi:P-type E1-E2 ATPase